MSGLCLREVSLIAIWLTEGSIGILVRCSLKRGGRLRRFHCKSKMVLNYTFLFNLSGGLVLCDIWSVSHETSVAKLWILNCDVCVIWTVSKTKALAKGTRNSTYVFYLPFSSCISLGHPLALTCDDLRWLWSSSNSYASFSPFGHPTQVDTTWLQVNCICVKVTSFCDLPELASRPTNPFGHPLLNRVRCLLKYILVIVVTDVFTS